MNAQFCSGFVTIVGKPNVGKSTLMNRLLGEKLSIISPKPQTTRQQVKGIYNAPEAQIVFLDTPGFLKPRYELQERMVEYIKDALKDTDLVLFITDVTSYPTDYDEQVCAIIRHSSAPKIAVLNKIDLVEQDVAQSRIDALKSLFFDEVIPISALNIDNPESLLTQIASFLPFAPPYFATDEISDLPMRFFVQEIVREQIFLRYRDEIPYASTVTCEKYEDFPNKVVIAVNLWLERSSQKPILLGAGGQNIKALRQAAEKEIHAIVGKRVKLDIWIKIKQNWRKKKNALSEFGYH